MHNELVLVVRDMSLFGKLFEVRFSNLVYGENSDGRGEITLYV
jgi:hypothetical protein